LYGKCFTDASENSFPKLEPSELFSEGGEKFETHKYLMDLRHQFIAHRGDTASEVGVAYLLVPKSDSLDKTRVQFNQLKI